MSTTRMGRSAAAAAYNAAHMGELAQSAATEASRAFFAGWAQTRLDYAAARDRQETSEIIRLGQLLADYRDEFERTAY